MSGEQVQEPTPNPSPAPAENDDGEEAGIAAVTLSGIMLAAAASLGLGCLILLTGLVGGFGFLQLVGFGFVIVGGAFLFAPRFLLDTFGQLTGKPVWGIDEETANGYSVWCLLLAIFSVLCVPTAPLAAVCGALALTGNPKPANKILAYLGMAVSAMMMFLFALGSVITIFMD